jgi:hypothetical protein
MYLFAFSLQLTLLKSELRVHSRRIVQDSAPEITPHLLQAWAMRTSALGQREESRS